MSRHGPSVAEQRHSDRAARPAHTRASRTADAERMAKQAYHDAELFNGRTIKRTLLETARRFTGIAAILSGSPSRDVAARSEEFAQACDNAAAQLDDTAKSFAHDITEQLYWEYEAEGMRVTACMLRGQEWVAHEAHREGGMSRK